MAPRSSAALLALVGVGLVALGCKRSPSKLDPLIDDAPPGSVPRARMPIKIDGEWSEPAWNLQAIRGVFTADDGSQARPYSEIRLLRDDRDLLVGLYAADEDIESTDTFELTLGTLALGLHPTPTITPAAPTGARVAVDLDGTLDQPSDDDEEWVVELAVPLATLPPGPLAIHARRCDLPKDRKPRCGQWRGTFTR